MSNSQNNTTDTPQAVQNAFDTFMALRERGVDKDVAFRASDHMKLATNKGGDKGAMAAAAQILVWLGAGLLVIALVIGLTQPVSAAAPSKTASARSSANIITLPYVAQRCNPCSSSIPMPTLTPTPDVGEPPMPIAPAVNVEVQ